MVIDTDLVQKLAYLARLSLTPEETKQYAKELDDLLQFFDQLQEIDTEGVEPVRQVTGLQNALREDEVNPSEKEDALLECSPNSIVRRHILVQKTFS